MTDLTRADRMAALIRRPAFIATATVTVLALVLGGLAWNVGRHDASADATHSPRPGDSTSPTGRPSDDPWASLEPTTSFDPSTDPNGVTANLSASVAHGPVVPLDASFQLTSVDATPASVLASRMTVDPALAFSIVPDGADRAATLTPTERLVPGAVYRFQLHGTSGELLDSWAFQASQPLRIVGTMPEADSSDVPTDTGIELLFDQDGTLDAASHVAIEPATKGRFEQHGRTLVFVPDAPLTAATIYSVVVSPGATIEGIGEASTATTRFKFETAAKGTPTSSDAFEFQDVLMESATADRPILGLWWYGDSDHPPKTTKIEVFSLADLPAAVDAFQSLRTRPTWARWSNDGLVDTTKLHRVTSAKLRLEPNNGNYFVRLPNRLSAGWYLVQDSDGTKPVQTVLQVTDVAGYLAISETRMLVWANDLATGDPISGASATTDGREIGTTDAKGLLIGATPPSLLPQIDQRCSDPCDPVVIVRTADGRAIFLPTTQTNDKFESYGGAYYYSDTSPSYWNVFHTDRNRYRPGDTVNLWGVVRARDGGAIPASVRVDLTGQANDDNAISPPVASLTLTPAPTGAFTGSFALTGVSEGYYTLSLEVAGKAVTSTQISVGPIAKPAYHLEVTTGRRVYIAGDRIKVTVGASFFEGTPVPGVPVRISASLATEIEHVAKTDQGGTAIYRTTASIDPDYEGPTDTAFWAAPARAEEGEIAGTSREIVIFPSSRTIDATPVIAGGRVRVSGGVHLVDVDRLEAAIDAGSTSWELDPRGSPIGGATVTVRFYEEIPVHTKIGTEYDFIEKKAVAVYEDTIDSRAAGTIKVKTTSNGTFAASVRATAKDHDYRVVVSVTDPDGHVAHRGIYASRHPWSRESSADPSLQATGAAIGSSVTYGVGDRVDVTMHDPGTAQSSGDGTRYLFYQAQRGLREAKVQSSPRFVTTFRRWAVPDMEISAVRFTGVGYVGTVGFGASFRTSDRRLQVDLTPDAARYIPGGRATVAIRTRDASGSPVGATVILRAVDEKLFSIGAASQDDPLAELYRPVGSGLLATYQSHRTPRGQTGEGGDTGGGGGDEDRSEFRDALLFTSVTTGADGRGSASFALSDDLTSWRVSASAITAALDAGYGSVLMPVGLPFFVDASIAPEYLLIDRPSIPVRVYGSAVTSADPVTIRVTSPNLLFDSGPIRTTAFTTKTVPLPPLRLGRQTITIRATSGAGASARTDAVTRTFMVVDTRLSAPRTAYVELPATGGFDGGDDRTTVVISDASAGRYLPLLTDLASGGGARLDRALAAAIAQDILATSFADEEASLPGGTFDASRYQTKDGGLAILPYASSDLELSALVAIVAPDRVDRSLLGSYLRGIRTAAGETRERQLLALAGLAGLGEPVMLAIQASAADPALTDHERLMLGLGAAALGDAATAKTVSATLIAERGQRIGDQARLRVGTTGSEITEATTLMAILTAWLGDPQASSFWAYVEANPAVDRLAVLEAAAYVSRILDRLPVAPASFTYMLSGKRTSIDLKPGQSFKLDLTATELRTLTVEPITGTIGVTTRWQEAIKPSNVVPDPDVKLTRTISPTTIASGDLVTITLQMTFEPQAAAGCHQVTELVPSGLTPVGSLQAWPDGEGEGGVDVATVMPYDQSGSRVFFCAKPSPMHFTMALRYYARVVTPGTYAWEPAVAASQSQDGQATLTPAGTVTIH